MAKTRDEWTITAAKSPRGPRLRRFIAWWERIAAGGTLPGRQHFDLAEWKKDLAWVGIVEIVLGEDGKVKDGLFRLWGTQLVYHFGGEPTGKVLGEYGREYLERWGDLSDRCFESRRPAIATGKILVPDFDYHGFEVALLPLFDDQARVSQFLVTIELIPRDIG